MGGRSSKCRKSTASLTVHECPMTLSQTDSKNVTKKKKGAKKNNVKIRTDKKATKKHKSFCEAQNVEIMVEDLAASGHDHLVPNSPVYRKKSSCPSCEAKDILLGKNRSRSGSERSLRFSDFNKVLRKTRVYDWEMTPLDIPLDVANEPVPEDVCYICGVYTGYHVRICRVCLKAYHDGCLSKIGHPLTERSRRLIACKQWSCHQCVALNHLLTQEEVREALEDLEDMDISKDKITEADYLNYCKQSMAKEGRIFTAQKETSSMARFHLMAKSGAVNWTDFLNMESIRILNRRNKDSLVHLLTQSEVSEARKAFKQLDNKGMGLVSKCDVQTFFDSNKTRDSCYYPDDSMIYMDEDLESPVTWGEFLRDRAIFFLGQRPNLMKVLDSVGQDENLDKENYSISFDSIYEGDEDYSTCVSESSSQPPQDNHHVSSKTESQVQASEEHRINSVGNKTMLDDIDKELKKSHQKQEIHAESAGLDTKESDGKEGKVISGNVRSSRPTPDWSEAALFNDSLQFTIPWDNLGDRSPQRSSEEKITHRRSEVITRKQVRPNQARAVSQVNCKSGKNVMAPAYGSLVGRVHNEEWGF